MLSDREFAAVTWDDEVDVASEAAYSLATGSALPSWMNGDEHIAER